MRPSPEEQDPEYGKGARKALDPQYCNQDITPSSKEQILENVAGTKKPLTLEYQTEKTRSNPEGPDVKNEPGSQLCPTTEGSTQSSPESKNLLQANQDQQPGVREWGDTPPLHNPLGERIQCHAQLALQTQILRAGGGMIPDS